MDENVILEEIRKRHFAVLKHLNEKHGKLIVCSAGIPGSGKTHVAKLVEERYRGVRISNDELRNIIKSLIVDSGKETRGDEARREELVKKYLFWLLESDMIKNGLIILDSGIERKYERVFEIAKRKGFKIFIIDIKVSKEVAEKRAFSRKGGRDEHFIRNIERWMWEHEEFNKKVKAGIKLKNDGGIEIERLFSVLDRAVG